MVTGARPGLVFGEKFKAVWPGRGFSRKGIFRCPSWEVEGHGCPGFEMTSLA